MTSIMNLMLAGFHKEQNERMEQKINQVKEAYEKISKELLHSHAEKIEIIKALNYYKHNASIDALKESGELIQRKDGSYTIKGGGLAKMSNAMKRADKAIRSK